MVEGTIRTPEWGADHKIIGLDSSNKTVSRHPPPQKRQEDYRFTKAKTSITTQCHLWPFIGSWAQRNKKNNLLKDIFQQLKKFDSRLYIKENCGIINFVRCDNGIVLPWNLRCLQLTLKKCKPI